MKWHWALLALVVGLTPPVRAEPLESKRVAAEARWVVHIDVDALRTGEIPRAVARLWSQLPAAAEHRKNLRQLEVVLGVDAVDDLHDITIYGERFDAGGAVVLLQVDIDREVLAKFLTWQPGYQPDSHGDHELFRWTENRGKRDEHTMTGCLHPTKGLVLGRDAEQVKKALDVLDGRSPPLAADSPLAQSPVPAGTMVQARAVGLAEVDLPFKSPLVRKSRVFVVAAGEHDGRAFALARASTESAETAVQLQSVVDGFLAMAELQFDADAQVTQLLEAVEVSTNDQTVAVEVAGPIGEVLTLIEKAWKKRFGAE